MNLQEAKAYRKQALSQITDQTQNSREISGRCKLWDVLASYVQSFWKSAIQLAGLKKTSKNYSKFQQNFTHLNRTKFPLDSMKSKFDHVEKSSFNRRARLELSAEICTSFGQSTLTLGHFLDRFSVELGSDNNWKHRIVKIIAKFTVKSFTSLMKTTRRCAMQDCLVLECNEQFFNSTTSLSK